MIETVLANGLISDHCGICGSRVLHYEDGQTQFASLKEAGPSLVATIAANLQTRACLDAAGLTFDKAKSN